MAKTNKLKIDKKLSSRQNSARPTPVFVPSEIQDWNYIIGREEAEDVVQEILCEILRNTNDLVLCRYAQNQAIDNAVERVKNDIFHMCEWLYAKRDIELDEYYFNNLDDEEPSASDMDSLGSGCLPSMDHVISNMPFSLSVNSAMCENAVVDIICKSVEICHDQSVTKDDMQLMEQVEAQSKRVEELIVTSGSSVKECPDRKKDARMMKPEPSLPESRSKSASFKTVSNIQDNTISVEGEVPKPPLSHTQRRLVNRKKSQSFEKRVSVSYHVNGQISCNKTTKDSQTYKEIMAHSKMNVKNSYFEMSAIEPRPTTIDSIKLSEGVAIYHMDKLKINPLQMKEVNQCAAKLEKSKALQPISGWRKEIIEPTISTQVRVNSFQRPLTLPPITGKNSRTLH